MNIVCEKEDAKYYDRIINKYFSRLPRGYYEKNGKVMIGNMVAVDFYKLNKEDE